MKKVILYLLLFDEPLENYRKLEGLILIILLAHKYQISSFLLFIIPNNYYPHGDTLLNINNVLEFSKSVHYHMCSSGDWQLRLFLQTQVSG